VNKKVSSVIGASILQLGIAAACSLGGAVQAEPVAPEPTGPIVSLAVASSFDEQGRLVDPAFTFSPDQPQITVIVQVGQGFTTPLEIVWYQVTEESEEQLFAVTLAVAALDRAYSVGQNPGTLAPGTYRVTATLDGQTQETEFDVAGEPPETTANTGGSAAGEPPVAGPSGTTPQASPAPSASGSSGSRPWAGLGPGNYPFIDGERQNVDLHADTVEIYPFFSYSGEMRPDGSFPGFFGTVRGSIDDLPGSSYGADIQSEGDLGPHDPVTLDPCVGGAGASDLPGTQVRMESTVTMDEGGSGPIRTEESVIVLGDDTLAPRVGVISTPARGSKVMPGDPIVLTVTATEKRSGGPWQMGVERIQVIGPEGLVDSQDYQDYRGKACNAKSWEQTFEVTYTVPENPGPQIELCAIGEDFAGNTYSRCGTFYTVDVWKGTLHTESSESGILNCTEIWDMQLVFTVSEDGAIQGAGKGTLVGQKECYSLDLPDHDFSDQAVSIAFNVEGSADRNQLNLQLVLFDVQGGGFNGLLNYSLFGGPSNSPAILEVPIRAPGIASGLAVIKGTAENGEAYSADHWLDLTCDNCEE
jgi:hypothetical protein